MARGRTQSEKRPEETKAISLSSDPILLRRCVFDGPSISLDLEGMCMDAVRRLLYFVRPERPSVLLTLFLLPLHC
jgi:hypothetical protein